MEKDKSQKKIEILTNIKSLPIPPVTPIHYHQQQHNYYSNQLKDQQSASMTANASNSSSTSLNVPSRLLDYKDREASFLKALNESILADCKRIKSESSVIINSDEIKKMMQSSSTSSVASASADNAQHHHQHHQQQQQQQNGSSVGLSHENHNNMSAKCNNLSEKTECELLKEECENFIMPLLNRTGPSISAALVAYDAFEQLNCLHGLLDQMLAIQEQNYQMKRYLRDVRTITELKKLQRKVESNEIINEADELSDTELDIDNQILNTILAAGNSASTKRNSAKRQRERSKSVIADDIQMFTEKEQNKLSHTQRRQSAFSETKAKVSKWIKVKAAFKWERANVPALPTNEVKSSDSGIGINHEVARYLRVPSVPCAGSSADSVLSSSSGHLLSCGGSIPATPGTISSASSTEDFAAVSEEIRQNRDSSKSESRCDSRANEEDSRRSHSLDGDATKKDKTAWRKVKDIIQTHRGSFKGKPRSRSIKSNESTTCSRDVSPCESLETVSNTEERTESTTSPLLSPSNKNVHSLNITSNDVHQQNQDLDNFSSSPNFSGTSNVNALYRDEIDVTKVSKASVKGIRKSKVLSDFEALPEGVVVNLKSNYNKLPPSPLGLNVTTRQDSSDTENIIEHSPTFFAKSSNRFFKARKSLSGILGSNSSVPNSPSRHYEFFSGELESEDLSSGDFSEPCTPSRKLSLKSSLQSQQEEISAKYIELRNKLNQEFEQKRQEWEKIRTVCGSTTSSALHIISKDECLIQGKKVPSKLLEDNLPADFKRKFQKWQVKKQFAAGPSTSKDPQISPTKEHESKKIDWNLWKTGQLKLEGQGLQPLPDQKDLPEDFQKKLEQWKKMKETNSVPTYHSNDSLKRKSGLITKFEDSTKKYSKNEIGKNDKHKDRDKSKLHEKDKPEKLSKLKAIVTDARAKEIQVQTSKGVMKFEGISRKFTRKLYEWEKARGIGPEMSTFALLHPGYRPLDVGNGMEENKTHENSSSLGRSLSLDSISPSINAPQISHQPSSLSLNDMDDLKDTNSSNERKSTSNPEMNNDQQQDEPEAVIVEVEDDIIETAAPLVTAVPIIEQQTPVYRYEDSRSEIYTGNEESLIQKNVNYQFISSSEHELSTQALESVSNFNLYLQRDDEKNYKKNIEHIQSLLLSLKNSLPELERCTREGSPRAKDTLEVSKKLINEIMEMLEQLNDDEIESKESLATKTKTIDTKLRTLRKSIDVICKYVELTRNQSSDHVPEINVTSDDGVDKSIAIVSTTPTLFQSQVVINQPKILMGLPPLCLSDSEGNNNLSVLPSSQVIDSMEGASRKMMVRNASNGSKKKIRLRKMGSRQNSKTESDSTSDEDATNNAVLEAPKRVKRKTSRAKRSTTIDDEKKSEDKKEEQYTGEDIVYVLKLKPGQIIEQTEKMTESRALISPTESCVQLMEASQENLSNVPTNIFVKTKRKIFTTVQEPVGEYKTVLIRDIETTSSASDRNERESSESDKPVQSTSLKSSQPIIQSSSDSHMEAKAISPKEPSPAIRMMIDKYNEKLATESSSVTVRSPILDRRVREQKVKYENEHVLKSASAGNIRHDNKLIPVEISLEDYLDDSKLQKSSSAGFLPSKKDENIAKNILQASKDFKRFPRPLACDSLQMITKKSSPILPKKFNQPVQEVERKEHLYRKNKEKPTSLFGKTGAIRKIGTKNAKSEFIWRRSISTFGDNSVLPNRSYNTGPKITRKLDSKNSPTSEMNEFENQFDKNIFRISVSAPTTPSEEVGRPKTPVSERALKLKKAKEEFLRDRSGSPIMKNNEDEASGYDEIVWKKRLSQASVGSETSNEEGVLLKSASVGLIGSSTNGDNEHHIDGYVSLPRNVSRSGKLISKFGFSSLASKFRKVKMRRGSKDSNITRMNAVSALCRQSLAIDMTSSSEGGSFQKQQQQIHRTSAVYEQSNISSVTGSNNLPKSGSTQAISFGGLFRKNDKDKINKSKSAGTVLGNDGKHQ